MTTMQSIHRIFAIATLAAVTCLCQALHAQDDPFTSRVSVPFAFDCGSAHYAPGTYTLGMLNQEFLTLGDNRARTGFILISADYDRTANASGYVVFRKYGNRYFLSEYHPAGTGTTFAVPPSKVERSLAHDYARNAGPARVQLALNGDAGRPAGQ